MSEISYAGDESHASDENRDAHPGGVPHAAIHGVDAHGAAARGDHAHDAPLGPIDWFAWGAGLLGIGAAAVVAVCLYVTTSL